MFCSASICAGPSVSHAFLEDPKLLADLQPTGCHTRYLHTKERKLVTLIIYTHMETKEKINLKKGGKKVKKKGNPKKVNPKKQKSWKIKEGKKKVQKGKKIA